MAPPQRTGLSKRPSSKGSAFAQFCNNYCSVAFIKSCVFEPARLPLISVFILLAELLLNVFVVQRVPYTEIDWKAYMQECEGFLNGTTDYSQLRGNADGFKIFRLVLKIKPLFSLGQPRFQATPVPSSIPLDSSTSTRSSTMSPARALMSV